MRGAAALALACLLGAGAAVAAPPSDMVAGPSFAGGVGTPLGSRTMRVWATTAVLAMAGGLLVWAARARHNGGFGLGAGASPSGGHAPLRVVAQKSLAGAHRVALLEVDGAGHSERLVVALSPQGANLLARLPAPGPRERGHADEADAPRSAKSRRPEPLEVAL